MRLVIAAACVVLFGAAALEVFGGRTAGFDGAVCRWFYCLRGPALTLIMKVITYSAQWFSIVAIGLTLLIIPGTRLKAGLPYAATVISSTLIYKILKELFRRVRPDEALHLVVQGGWSFPSGHSMNGLVAYGILAFLLYRYAKNKKAAGALCVLAALHIVMIGVSRIYLGVHWPTDVLAGWALGTAVLMAGEIITEKLMPDGEGSRVPGAGPAE